MIDWRQTDRAEVEVQVVSIGGVGREGETQVKAIVEGVSPQNLPVNLYLPVGVTPEIGKPVRAVITKGRFNPKKMVNGQIPPGAPTWDWFYDCAAYNVDPGQQPVPTPPQSPGQPRNPGSGSPAPQMPTGDARDASIKAQVAAKLALQDVGGGAEASVIYERASMWYAIIERLAAERPTHQPESQPDAAFDALGEQPPVPAAPQDPPAQTDLGW
jgi:hypothetical protein